MNIDRQMSDREHQQELTKENERLRKILRDEFGMMNETGELSPELENEWLKQVYAFEVEYAKRKKTSVYDYIGRPDFIGYSMLKKRDVSRELAKIIRAMSEANVEFSAHCKYDDMVIYQFITEELFRFEMDDIRVEGMKTYFLYEEFHPNHEYDIRNTAADILRYCLCKEFKIMQKSYWLHDTVRFRGKVFTREEFVMQMLIVKEMFDTDEIEKTDVKQIDYDLEKCCATVRGSFTLGKGEECRKQGFEMGMTYKFDAWMVSSLALDGFDDL